MAYLDVSTMIAALRECPDEFDMRRGWLRHLPSRHRFQFDAAGGVRLDAACECAMLSVDPDQMPELHRTFESWRSLYWEPILINRQFAAHFKRTNPWKRFCRRILEKMGRRACFAGFETELDSSRSRKVELAVAPRVDLSRWGRWPRNWHE